MSNSAEKLKISPEVMQRAVAVGPRASIQSIRIANVSAMLGVLANKTGLSSRHDRSHSFSRVDEKHAEVTISFSLDIASSEEEKQEPPISIEARYLLVYEVEDMASLDDEHLDAFAKVNGYFNSWPFWRELTTSMLARTQSAAFILPSLRIESSAPEANEEPTEAESRS